MINETQNTEVTTPVSNNRTPPNVPFSGRTPQKGLETQIQLIPWHLPAQPHSGWCTVDFPSVAGAVSGTWDEAVTARRAALHRQSKNSLNSNLSVFDRVSPSGPAGVVPESSTGFVTQYTTCLGAAELPRRSQQGWWHCSWGTGQAWAAWPAASPAWPS